MILFVKDDGHVGPFQRPPGVSSWLHGIDLSRPLLELAVRGVQRGTSVNAHGFSCFLELLLAGFFSISPVTFFSFFLLMAPGGPIVLLWGLAAASSLVAAALPTIVFSISLLAVLLILCSLILDELLNLVGS